MSNPNLTKKIAMMAVFVMLIPLAEPLIAQGNTADLAVTPADITFSKDTPTAGEIVTITIKVHDNGPAGATNVVVNFFVDNVPLPPDKTISSISAMGQGSASHNWSTPAPTTYTIKVTVHGDQTDPVQTNNQAERTITVGNPVPTINVTATISPDTIESKGLFIVNGTAKYGNQPVNNGDVKVEITPGGFANSSKTTSAGNFSVIMNSPAGQGIYNVKVTVKQGALSGSTKLNLTVLQSDLNITKISFSNTKPTEDDLVKVTLTIVNLGSGSAKNVEVQIKVDNVAVFQKKVGDFAACQTQSVSYDWKAKKGSHDFSAMVDPNNTIEETHENNNAISASIVVKEKAKKPGPAFEAPVFIASVLVIFFIMRSRRDRKTRI